jgi:hypothetical protein
MKTVTIIEFYNFRAALAALHAVNAKHARRLNQAGAAVLATADTGRHSRVVALATAAKGVATMAKAAIDHAKAGAALEAATVALLGERRRLGESMADYLARIQPVIDHIDTDPAPFLAMLARNGLRLEANTHA